MWPKKSIYWQDGRTLKVSIPFTWELPKVAQQLRQRSLFTGRVLVGGPAVELMPGFFNGMDGVVEGHEEPGVLQRINQLATRTTTGCIRRCKFCGIGVGKIEKGGFKELKDWPDLPMITDNNLLAASKSHFDRVIKRLVRHGWADFNQGIDARLLTEHHAAGFSLIKKPTLRLALDHMDYKEQWQDAYDRLIAAGIAKRNISSYCIVGFNSSPQECWCRCEWVESHGIKAYPMWYHSLHQLDKNIVTPEQAKLGWTDTRRKEIMGYYYKHRGHVPSFV